MATSFRLEIFPADLEATADFYTRVLRFELAQDKRDDPEPYLFLRRDEVRLGALQQPAPPARDLRRPPVGVELVLVVDDLQAERDHVAAAAWPVTDEITDRPWGLRDFRLLDPVGYYWRITTRR